MSFRQKKAKSRKKFFIRAVVGILLISAIFAIAPKHEKADAIHLTVVPEEDKDEEENDDLILVQSSAGDDAISLAEELTDRRIGTSERENWFDNLSGTFQLERGEYSLNIYFSGDADSVAFRIYSDEDMDQNGQTPVI